MAFQTFLLEQMSKVLKSMKLFFFFFPLIFAGLVSCLTMATQGQCSHYEAPRHYKMFPFSSVALNGLNACKCTLECTEKPSPARWDVCHHVTFRACGTWEEFHVHLFTVFRMDYFHLLTGLSALECFCLSSLAAKVLDASHHRICTKMFPRTSSHPFLYFNISFCWRTSAFYDWSNILFVLSDLCPFGSFTPCFKKKKKEQLIERK